MVQDSEMTRLLTTEEASHYLRRSVPTLQIDRHKGRGCKYIKSGGKVFYRMKDILEYLESCVVEPGNKIEQT